ncbi:hypothetical protein E5259_14830 [Blautia producta]|uniref:Uncharacterized protein n=1 Tax=Blautia producta TaxID=33035 RepID=A0A7G5MVW7_9FIRM|nr:hypothetical protein E5259_14830 [Blautia producta]DAG12850.1 MAG TPA: hypothetical protein [Caudoviricetes sp.]
MRLPICGGRWNNTSSTGVFNVNLNNSRSNSNSNIGFRSALLSYARGAKFKDFPTVREDKGACFHSGLKGRRKNGTVRELAVLFWRRQTKPERLWTLRVKKLKAATHSYS